MTTTHLPNRIAELVPVLMFVGLSILLSPLSYLVVAAKQTSRDLLSELNVLSSRSLQSRSAGSKVVQRADSKVNEVKSALEQRLEDIRRQLDRKLLEIETQVEETANELNGKLVAAVDK